MMAGPLCLLSSTVVAVEAKEIKQSVLVFFSKLASATDLPEPQVRRGSGWERQSEEGRRPEVVEMLEMATDLGVSEKGGRDGPSGCGGLDETTGEMNRNRRIGIPGMWILAPEMVGRWWGSRRAKVEGARWRGNDYRGGGRRDRRCRGRERRCPTGMALGRGADDRRRRRTGVGTLREARTVAKTTLGGWEIGSGPRGRSTGGNMVRRAGDVAGGGGGGGDRRESGEKVARSSDWRKKSVCAQ